MIFQLIANGIPIYEKEDGSALPKTDDEVLLALIMAQASEKKIEHVSVKLGKLDVFESRLNDMNSALANIEHNVSRLDAELRS